MNGQDAGPTQIIEGRDGLTPVFEDLNRYQATQHFNGQSTIDLDEDRATGESYCIAYHLFTEDGARKVMLAHLRDGDAFVKQDGAWLFADRTSMSIGSRQGRRIPSRSRRGLWPAGESAGD